MLLLPLSRRWAPLLLAAVLGAVVTLAGGLALGVLHGRAPETVVEPGEVSVNVSSRPDGPWRTIYARVAPGTVQVSVQVTRTRHVAGLWETTTHSVLGAGFVLDGRGRILTALHVVSDRGRVTVTFANGQVRVARILEREPARDLAILEVDPAGLTLHPLALGSTRRLQIGDAVALIGTPLGFGRSLSTGVVSALGRVIEAPDGRSVSGAVQTDAAMNPGNSGGPLIDAQGRVIGVADQIAIATERFGSSSRDTDTGVGFALPVELVRAAEQRLAVRGRAG